jgi:hypothetical protein
LGQTLPFDTRPLIDRFLGAITRNLPVCSRPKAAMTAQQKVRLICG